MIVNVLDDIVGEKVSDGKAALYKKSAEDQIVRQVRFVKQCRVHLPHFGWTDVIVNQLLDNINVSLNQKSENSERDHDCEPLSHPVLIEDIVFEQKAMGVGSSPFQNHTSVVAEYVVQLKVVKGRQSANVTNAILCVLHHLPPIIQELEKTRSNLRQQGAWQWFSFLCCWLKNA
jgi:hypothetical protein